GGSIWDLGSYPVNFMRTMLGSEPLAVHGWHNASESGVDLSFAGQMRFANGALAQFFSSFQTVPHADVDILGSAGKIHLDLPYVNKIGVRSQVHIVRAGETRSTGTFSDSAAEVDEETLTYEDVNAYACEVDALVDSILDGAEPMVPLSDSRGNAAALAALCISARENRPVALK
ncbi:MAG TPA: Gfo/Idh/MocA family oxidoreductase, partial [Planctomycetaceae bacterium]|nr:Gfo/Idh/MocA family oxidoreductase [Planctomycetaceae bacterium]